MKYRLIMEMETIFGPDVAETFASEVAREIIRDHFFKGEQLLSVRMEQLPDDYEAEDRGIHVED